MKIEGKQSGTCQLLRFERIPVNQGSGFKGVSLYLFPYIFVEIMVTFMRSIYEGKNVV